MASMNMNIFTLVQLTAGNRNPTNNSPRRQPNSVCFAANSAESPPPEIELEFIGVIYNIPTSLFIDRLYFVPINVSHWQCQCYWNWNEKMFALQPKPGGDGLLPVDKAKAISGKKLLRNIMLDNKIELYATYVHLTPHISNPITITCSSSSSIFFL